MRRMIATTCVILGQPPSVVRQMTLRECQDTMDAYRRLSGAERS